MISTVSTCLAVDGQCLLHGFCGETDKGIVPCYVKRDHHQYEDSSDTLELLRSYCPELFLDGVAIPETCCSPADVKRMQMAFQRHAAPYQDCESCFANVRGYICHAHCAPNQDQFLEIKKVVNVQNGTAVEEMDYYMTRKFVEGFVRSCQKLPAFIQLLKDIGCENSCDLDTFVANVGKAGVRLPFTVNFKIINEGQTITINGIQGEPADIPFRMCKNNCSDVCPSE